MDIETIVMIDKLVRQVGVLSEAVSSHLQETLNLMKRIKVLEERINVNKK